MKRQIARAVLRPYIKAKNLIRRVNIVAGMPMISRGSSAHEQIGKVECEHNKGYN